MVPDQSRAERTTSYDVADFPLPTGREEEWRFTPVDRIGMLFRDEATGAHLTWSTPFPTASRCARHPPRRSATGRPGAAVTARPSSPPPTAAVPRCSRSRPRPSSTEPVRLRLHGESSDVVHGHLVVRLGRFARATVVIEHEGTEQLRELVSVVTGDGSQLTLVSVQEWDDTVHHLAQHDVVVGRDASVATSPSPSAAGSCA
jgi:Fe-S cluster assembly protein SufD